MNTYLLIFIFVLIFAAVIFFGVRAEMKKDEEQGN